MKTILDIKFSVISCLLLNLLLIAGLTGYINSGLFKGIFALHATILMLASLFAVKKISDSIRQSDRILSFIGSLALMLGAIFCLSEIILPVTARDALIHHLAIPKLWIKQGIIEQINWHQWSYYPMLIQLAFAAILQILPEQFCSLYIFLYLPLLLSATFSLASVLDSKKNLSCFCLFLAVSIPVLLKLSAEPMVDLPLTFFCSAGLLFLLKAESEKNTSNIIFSSLAFGLALSTKLNSLPFLFFSILAFLAKESNLVLKKRIFISSQVLVLSLVVFTPWLIKNYLWTANPLYPYGSSVFNSSISSIDSGLKGLNPLQQRLMLYGESVTEIVLLPLRMFFEGRDNNPRYFDGVFNPFLIIGLIYALFNFRNSTIRLFLLIICSVTVFSLFSTGARIRYLAPVYPLLIALAAIAFSYLNSLSVAGRMAVRVSLLVQILLTANYIYRHADFTSGYEYLTSKLSKEQYLLQKIPEYPLINFSNHNLAPGSKLYLVYTGNQFYLYENKIFSSGHTSADHLLSWIRNSRDEKMLADKLTEGKITHLIISEEKLYHVLSSTLNKQQKDIWNDFFNSHLLPIYSERGFSLYELKQSKIDDVASRP